jgi:hypothetical protein
MWEQSAFCITAHEVRQRARCHNFGVKGNNTYQIVYRGGSFDALMGAANTKMDGQE